MMAFIISQNPDWGLETCFFRPKQNTVYNNIKHDRNTNFPNVFFSFWQEVRKFSSFISGNKKCFWQDVRTLSSFIYSKAQSNLRWRRDLLQQGGCNEPLRGFASEQARCRVALSCFSSFNHKLWAPGRRQRQGESHTDPEMTVITHLLYKLGQSTRQARN